jgi:hypothetical protein
MERGNFNLIYTGELQQVCCPGPVLFKIYEYIDDWLLKSFIGGERVEKIYCPVDKVLMPGGVAIRRIACPAPIFENVCAMINNWKLTNNGKPFKTPSNNGSSQCDQALSDAGSSQSKNGCVPVFNVPKSYLRSFDIKWVRKGKRLVDERTGFDYSSLEIYAKIRKGVINKTLKSLSYKTLLQLFGVGQMKASQLRDQLIKDGLAVLIKGGQVKIMRGGLHEKR